MAFFMSSSLIVRRLSLTGRHSSRGGGGGYKWFKYLLIGALFLIVSFQARDLFQSAAQGSVLAGSFMARARSAQVNATDQSGIARPILMYFVECVTYTSILFLTDERDRLFWLTFTIAFVSCVVGAGRIAFLLLFSGVTCVYLIKDKRENFMPAFRFARWPFFAFLFIFFILMFTAKDTSGIKSSAAMFAEHSLIQYIIGPTAALDYVLQHPSEYVGAPNHTFKLFLGVASSVGLINYAPPPAFDSFLFVPFPTNVYTVYKYYITDFGVVAALAISTIMGFGHAFLYRKAHAVGGIWLYMFAVTMGTVITVIFDDGYSNFGVFSTALLFGLLFFSLKRIGLGLRLKAKTRKSIATTGTQEVY